ncbi:MAG TPA: hypothetical protein DCP38_04460 [Acidobacteria bacterium]|nr:hypothetical protein [Acidobacteriota bacterium]
MPRDFHYGLLGAQAHLDVAAGLGPLHAAVRQAILPAGRVEVHENLGVRIGDRPGEPLGDRLGVAQVLGLDLQDEREVCRELVDQTPAGAGHAYARPAREDIHLRRQRPFEAGSGRGGGCRRRAPVAVHHPERPGDQGDLGGEGAADHEDAGRHRVCPGGGITPPARRGACPCGGSRPAGGHRSPRSPGGSAAGRGACGARPRGGPGRVAGQPGFVRR